MEFWSFFLCAWAFLFSSVAFFRIHFFIKSHRVDGFVKVPAHLREQRVDKAYEEASRADRTTSAKLEVANGPRTAHTRTARMRGRRRM